MSMGATHEQLRALEKFSGRGPRGTGLDARRAEALAKDRRAMLEEIAADVAPEFLAALRAKLEYERALLAKLADSLVERALAERSERRDAEISAEYFSRTPLNPHIF